MVSNGQRADRDTAVDLRAVTEAGAVCRGSPGTGWPPPWRPEEEPPRWPVGPGLERRRRVGRTFQAEGRATARAQGLKALGMLGEGDTPVAVGRGSAREASGGKRRGWNQRVTGNTGGENGHTRLHPTPPRAALRSLEFTNRFLLVVSINTHVGHKESWDAFKLAKGIASVGGPSWGQRATWREDTKSPTRQEALVTM